MRLSLNSSSLYIIFSGGCVGTFGFDMYFGFAVAFDIVFIFGIRNIPIEAGLSRTFAAHSSTCQPASLALTISGTVPFAPTSYEM